MSTRATVIFIAVLATAGLVYSFVMYPSLPPQVPIHWNIEGHADGWATKSTAIWIFAGAMAAFGAMLAALPWLSPRSFSIEPFRGTFNYTIAILALMFLGIHILSLQASLHPKADFGKPLMSMLFLFFALLGNVLGKTRKNFYMGYRCPWTLASDTVWMATHRLGGRLMFAGGLFGAVGIWLGLPMPFLFVLFLVMIFVPYIYALVLYKRLEREGQAPDAASPPA